MKLCECGCGQRIISKPWHNYDGIPRFIHGHYIRIDNPMKRPEVIKNGIIPWNKGKKLSEEHKFNISKAKKGHHPKTEFKKGHKPSDETKRKIGLANSISLKGKKHTEETKRKMSESQKGNKNGNWQGGITSINDVLRNSSKMKIWRELVFLRDNFTCKNPNCKFCNNKRGGMLLHPHHIKPLSFFPELAFNVNNGITYCAEFHLKSGLHKNIQNKIGVNV